MADQPLVSIEDRGNLVAVQVLAESLDPNQLDRLQREVAQVADAHPGRPIALDLSNVNFIPSLSLGVLIGLASDFGGRRQKLMLAGLQPRVRQVFTLARLDTVFDIHENVTAAESAIRSG